MKHGAEIYLSEGKILSPFIVFVTVFVIRLLDYFVLFFFSKYFGK